MQIQLASVIATFFICLAAALFAYNFMESYEYISSLYIGLCVVAAAASFTLSNQINWWWFERNPPRLDEVAVRILKANLPYFNNLSIDERKRFGSRVYMFLMDKDFVGAGTPDEEVPENIKVMVAGCVVQFTFGLAEYWLPDLEKVIIYPNPFPTRERPMPHAGEAHEDNCIILAAKLLREGMYNSTAFYHIGLHTAAEYWQLRNPVTLADLHIHDEEACIARLEQIRMFKKDFWRGLTGIYTIEQTHDIMQRIGSIVEEQVSDITLPSAPVFELAVECFFTKPNELAAALPETFAALMELLNQDPRKDTYPLCKPLAKW